DPASPERPILPPASVDSQYAARGRRPLMSRILLVKRWQMMMRARSLRPFPPLFTPVWLALSLLVLTGRAEAQGLGAIGGTVVDASGAVLPGVTVTLSNPLGSIGGNQSADHDERGAYQ